MKQYFPEIVNSADQMEQLIHQVKLSESTLPTT